MECSSEFIFTPLWYEIKSRSMAADIFATSRLVLVPGSREFVHSLNAESCYELSHRPLHKDTVTVFEPDDVHEHLGELSPGIYEPVGEHYEVDGFRHRGLAPWKRIVCGLLLSQQRAGEARPDDSIVAKFALFDGVSPRIGFDASDSLHRTLLASRQFVLNRWRKLPEREGLMRDFANCYGSLEHGVMEEFEASYDAWLNILRIGADGGIVGISL